MKKFLYASVFLFIAPAIMGMGEEDYNEPIREQVRKVMTCKRSADRGKELHKLARVMKRSKAMAPLAIAQRELETHERDAAGYGKVEDFLDKAVGKKVK